jgi:hypothetical protein
VQADAYIDAKGMGNGNGKMESFVKMMEDMIEKRIEAQVMELKKLHIIFCIKEY